MSDSQGTENYSYDVRGRVLQTQRQLCVNGQSYTTQSSYDNRDRPTSVVYPAGGPTVNYSYDGGGHDAAQIN